MLYCRMLPAADFVGDKDVTLSEHSRSELVPVQRDVTDILSAWAIDVDVFTDEMLNFLVRLRVIVEKPDVDLSDTKLAESLPSLLEVFGLRPVARRRMLDTPIDKEVLDGVRGRAA